MTDDHDASSELTPVYVESGKQYVFAAALDWPGWCRRGHDEGAALEALAAYADRYAKVIGRSFAPGELEVIGRARGTSTTDFGAPDALGPWDEQPATPEELDRLVGILETAWDYFDAVVSNAPDQLRKGPRGGGRDRDAIAEHVREAERAYASRSGTRIAPRTLWRDQRDAIAATLRAGSPGGKWPVRYGIRRFTWHVLDHAWEIEDKSS